MRQQQPLSSEDSESVNHSLLLIRNILHAAERPPVQLAPDASGPADEEAAGAEADANSGSNSGANSACEFQQHANGGQQKQHAHGRGHAPDCSQQNRLLWNLFAQGLDRVLIQLLGCSQTVSFTFCHFSVEQSKPSV